MQSTPNGYVRFNAANPAGSKYSFVNGAGNLPEDDVTFFDALRYVNWLNNGQGNGDTETGAYTLLGGTPIPSNGNTVARNPRATIFLPSLDEWYKAAYYDAATHAYFQYATSSNTAPVADLPTSNMNSANYNHVARGPTDVGAYTGTTSPCGAYDMSGNLRQWNETPYEQLFRGVAGGSWATGANDLSSSGYFFDTPNTTGNLTGFRVAMIPEPATLVLAALGALALLAMRRRR
ncbi:MAG TPA: SUMF1/EgtB/PvdO family nonheme iron enzyme [Pirellulales bacterium]|jgi:formylglycine-generating enzyme required for sulfatase activity